MSEVSAVSLGVDLGGTGIRAAYRRADEPARFLSLAGSRWLLCESATEGRLPVSFPSLKSRLGRGPVTEIGGEQVEAGSTVAEALAELRGRVQTATSARIGHTAISVPARFSSTQRTALLDAAQIAGLERVSLITDSVAAVIGHSDGAGTGTFLVYGMGYSGFELGLVRLTRGRYRVLGYEGANIPSGSDIDEQVLAAWLSMLRNRGSLPDEIHHGDAGWRRLRDLAERVKERLASGEAVLFPVFVAGSDGDLHLSQFDPESFQTLIRFLVAGTLDRADALFTQAGMNREDVDTVLLVGGSTRIPQLRDLVAGLGATVLTTSDRLIALGALQHARQMTGRVTDTDEQPTAAEFERPEPVLHAPPLAATLLSAPGGPRSGSETGADLDRARRLIAEGRQKEAEEDLRRLIAQAQDLLEEITADRPQVAPAPIEPQRSESNAADLMAVARRRLAAGQYKEAITLAHQSWRWAPDRPDLFEEMLDIHCAAATTDVGFDSFAQDERWLRCALTHDPTNVRIRGLLAERIYLHGRELHQIGKQDEAKTALQNALNWNPEHEPAETLLRRITRRRT
jgi:tetratricopeptide (TPR) repeat protein